MTMHTVEAVYEQGTFRLIRVPTIPFQEGQRVRIIVDTEYTVSDVLALATSVFDDLSAQAVQDIEAIARTRDSFFGIRP